MNLFIAPLDPWVDVYGFDLSIISGFVTMMVTVNGEPLGKDTDVMVDSSLKLKCLWWAHLNGRRGDF